MEGDAFFDLLGDAFGWFSQRGDVESESAVFFSAIGWRKGIVVAEGASAQSQRSVAVGAGETCIDRELLHSLAKEPMEIIGIG